MSAHAVKPIAGAALGRGRAAGRPLAWLAHVDGAGWLLLAYLVGMTPGFVLRGIGGRRMMVYRDVFGLGRPGR